MRSGCAEDAGATMPMVAPGATAGGLISAAPCHHASPRAMSAAGPVRNNSVSRARPTRWFARRRSDHGERRNATAQSQRRRGGGGTAGAGGGGGSDAALEDANFDFVFAHDAHKFHVGLVGKIAVGADFCADGLPGFAGNGEGRIVDQDHEVRIAGNDFNADDFSAARRA